MITHLAISGGGSSGIKFAGSLKYLEETNQLCNIKSILGTSIGAIIAVLLSYSTVDNIIKNINYLQGSLDIDDINLNSFIVSYGFLSKHKIIKSIETILKNQFDAIPTFLELFKLSRKEVIISSFNLNEGKVDYFSYKTHPDMCVLTALSLSINIPFIFEREIYNNNCYIDAGLMSNNLSWEYFNSVPSTNKLGIYLFIENSKSLLSPHTSLKNYILQIFKTYCKQSMLHYEKSICLSDENIFIIKEEELSFNMSNKLSLPSDEEIHSMLKHGYDEIQLYLKKKV